ncbi:hypothetical protein EYB45_03960 [Erythrobacteraceae bacterium CFH 75059]|uniref:GTA baseplate fiber-binding domain-containing protein n=1 Tax=Qipengyuania thermophila TaxID=2509361 RepID=UPI001022625C|nr:phage tail protein [Qipengyuania thermophila]TCD06839.1 hypothetical protein EYB45_03960 [Erythrobacteraceae bacterium CFH 75059]
MATLVLGAVGTAIGGPLGGAAGALLGQTLDGRLLRARRGEGPRLKELALTTSTYGEPLPVHHGSVRTGGSVIWADALRERAERGGGKGQPRTTRFSYSASFAVMVAGAPIDGIGRIWADGTLLRGAAGDLKTGGRLRIHCGHEDQECDPLLRAVHGASCPAYRGRAYAVFEDLDLGGYGNRLPALSFEVFAGDAAALVGRLVEGVPDVDASEVRTPALRGYSHEGGTVAEVLDTLSQLYPLRTAPAGAGLSLHLSATSVPPIRLGARARSAEGEFGRDAGLCSVRDPRPQSGIEALRYHDIDRDYQPGVQRALAPSGARRGRTLEFAGSLDADGARMLVDRAAQRADAAGETLAWRCAELDPALLRQGRVEVPGHGGVWRMEAWEWRSTGVELELVREPDPSLDAAPGAAGTPYRAADAAPAATRLRVFELPPSSLSETAVRQVFAVAATSAGAQWRPVALHTLQGGTLLPLDAAIDEQGCLGSLLTLLAPSPGLRLDPHAWCDILGTGDWPQPPPLDAEGLARGGNRMLVGSEVVQFTRAEPLGSGRWRLTGLLRGRGGTEQAAMDGHPAGAPVTLLTHGLTRLDLPDGGGEGIAALGFGDAEPVLAAVENSGASVRPLPPVHGRCRMREDGAVAWTWIRRARGAWVWTDALDVPLVEEREQYVVGFGPPEAPAARWVTDRPGLVLPGAEWRALATAFPQHRLWVQQSGTASLSLPAALPHPW